MKIVTYKGIKLRFISKNEFGKIIGRSYETIFTWINLGILLPPPFEDPFLKRKAFGKEFAYKFYLHNEAVAVRDVVRKYNPRKGWIPTKEFVDEIHYCQNKIRDAINSADPKLSDFPIVLEFTDFNDLSLYMKKMGAPPGLAESIYKGGDVFLGTNKSHKEKQDEQQDSKEKRKTNKEAEHFVTKRKKGVRGGESRIDFEE